MANEKKGKTTLLWSILMSAPGPLVVGLGLIVGQSSTQIADFVRRTAELLAIIASFVVFNVIAKNNITNEERKTKLEKRSNVFVGVMMCLAGSIMAVLSLTSSNINKGNVIPGLAIAVMGVIANSIFWVRYTKLNKLEPNAILAVQSRLYRAKTLVDFSITIALTAVLVNPTSVVAYWLDIVGSIIVAVYLIWCGIQTIYEENKLTKKD